MNLPNAITVGRIAVTPLIALCSFVNSWPLRALAFVIYIVTAISDYWDGMLARSRGLVTDLGKLLDPLADKLLLLCTLVGAGTATQAAGRAFDHHMGTSVPRAAACRRGIKQAAEVRHQVARPGQIAVE